MHSKEETPFPLRTIVSAILEPVAVTRRHRFRWVSTMSPTLISSMGFKCSEVNMRVPAGNTVNRLQPDRLALYMGSSRFS